MAIIRRIALIIVLVLLVVDVGLLAMVKLNVKPGPSSFNLVAQIEKPDMAKKVTAALEAEGFKPAVSESTKKNQLLDGFRVVMNNPAAVDSFGPVLKHEHITVKKADNGQSLMLPKIFKSKKQAQVEADKLTKYGFKVEENYKEITVKCSRLELKGLEPDKAEKAEKIFDENKVPVDKEGVEEGTPGTPSPSAT